MNRWVISSFVAITVMMVALAGCSKPRPEPSQRTQPQPVKESPQNLALSKNVNYAYLYGLNGFRFADLATNATAQVMVVDVDDAKLNASQVSQLTEMGKIVFPT